MKTLFIKTKSGRVLEVEKTHGQFLVAKRGATVVEKPIVEPVVEKPIVEPKVEKEKKNK